MIHVQNVCLRPIYIDRKISKAYLTTANSADPLQISLTPLVTGYLKGKPQLLPDVVPMVTSDAYYKLSFFVFLQNARDGTGM